MSEDNKKQKVLNLKRESRETAECAHDISLMVDLLAGEITHEAKPKLSAQLDSCKICRNKLAELNRIWSLTQEVLNEEIPSENVANLENAEKSNQVDNKKDAENESNEMEDTKLLKTGEKKSKKIKFAWLEIAASVIFLLFIVGALLPSLSKNHKNARKKESFKSAPIDAKNSNYAFMSDEEEGENVETEDASESPSVDLTLAKTEAIVDKSSISGTTNQQNVMKEKRNIGSIVTSKKLYKRKQVGNERQKKIEEKPVSASSLSIRPAPQSFRADVKIRKNKKTNRLPMSMMIFHVSAKLYRMMGGNDKEVAAYLKNFGVKNLRRDVVEYDKKSATLTIRGLDIENQHKLKNILKVKMKQ